MGIESFHASVRRHVRRFLQELDVAGVCIDEVRCGVMAQERRRVEAAAMSLFLSWARAERAIRSLEQVTGGGGVSEDFARDALHASYHDGVPVVSAALGLFGVATVPCETATSAIAVLDPHAGDPEV